MNASFPEWFARIARDYRQRYPPSDLSDDPVVCWRETPANGFEWHPGQVAIMGTRFPLLERESAHSSPSIENESEEMTDAPESEIDTNAAAMVAKDEEDATARATEGKSDGVGENENPFAWLLAETQLYEYRLSDFRRKGYYLVPLGGVETRLARRPLAQMRRNVRSSPFDAIRRLVPASNLDEAEE